jgi:hypothetical protein
MHMAPRAAITVTPLTRDGVTAPAATQGIAAGHAIANNGRMFIQFTNANAAARIVTLQTPPTYQGQAVAEHTITVPGSATNFKAGPFPQELFNRPSGVVDDPGMLYIDYPAANEADVGVRAFSI